MSFLTLEGFLGGALVAASLTFNTAMVKSSFASNWYNLSVKPHTLRYAPCDVNDVHGTTFDTLATKKGQQG